MHGWCIDECCDVILVVHAYITFLLFSHNISRQRGVVGNNACSRRSGQEGKVTVVS